MHDSGQVTLVLAVTTWLHCHPARNRLMLHRHSFQPRGNRKIMAHIFFFSYAPKGKLPRDHNDSVVCCTSPDVSVGWLAVFIPCPSLFLEIFGL